MRPREMRQWIMNALDDAKARDIVTLDVRKVCEFTDYMIIVSGTSNRHVVSIAEKVIDALGRCGLKPSGIEGKEHGDWVLIDFGDILVHVMRPQTRDFYSLEKLWSDARHVEATKS